MSLVKEQSIFLLHVSELIKKAAELGYVVSGGELYRTSEQQALHVKNGRSTTMNSQHLKRLAIDLNFFVENPDGSLKLTYDVEDLRPLGDYWESLDAANRWGGNWTSFKDTPHFERREGLKTAPKPTEAQPIERAERKEGLEPITIPLPSRRTQIIATDVGPRCPNKPEDVETVQRLLNISSEKGEFDIEDKKLLPDGKFGKKTLGAITAFQRTVLGNPTPDGLVKPAGPTMAGLYNSLPTGVDTTFLSLAYLRADGQDVNEFGKRIAKVMANRNIDTPLRQAHFVAQIGHESGELRFREEVASGQAYEGRSDLGNTEPGDGPRFKGRGLIQLTGRANYREYGRAIGREEEILKKPEIVATDPELCVDVAGWYWSKRNLNTYADQDDLTTITRLINGGLNGLEDRRRLLNRARSILDV
ncbi:hypothetical protein EH223_04420 [candidate division KSB1 bacterium]|nr:M15 family metallopeptidase [candidate division KSB1 bacterium]RQW05528.1 MAG: hypothetical protein EH223_04420 [candidate division KSB1 bacterium]